MTLKRVGWATELICYSQVLIGLQAATLSDWALVKKCLQTIQEAQPSPGFLDMMMLYLSGVFKQGTAKLAEALEIWKDPRFQLTRNSEAKASGNQVLSILAALNRLWIMQSSMHKNDAETAELMDLLRPVCEDKDNPDVEIRTAYHLVFASVQVSGTASSTIQDVKRHIQSALGGAQATMNTQFLSMALNIMRCRLFENVIGEQTVKSAKAGCTQAKKAGNVLWMSVAEGMLAQSYEMQGAMREAKAASESAVRLAYEAHEKTKV